MSWEPAPPGLLQPSGEIHLWRADLDAGGWPRREELPAADRTRAEGLVRAEPARRWVASRWALRSVLGRYLSQDPAKIELAVAPRGKPRLHRPGPLRFSLSHSENLILIAIGADREIGIDVERADPERDLVAIARSGLDPQTAEAVARAPAERRAGIFYTAWTRREAIAKCFGDGLGAAAPRDHPVEVCEIDAGDGWAAALVVAGVGMPALRRFELEPAGLPG